MNLRAWLALCCVAFLTAAAWVATREPPERKTPPAWVEVTPGVWRSPGLPASYALVAREKALLIDAANSAEGLAAAGVKQVETVLLTHHHRDTTAHAAGFLRDRVPVRAPKASLPWLSPDGVRQYWKE